MSEWGKGDAVRRWDSDTWSLYAVWIHGYPVRLHLSLLLFVVACIFWWLGWAGLVLAGAMLAAVVVHELGHVAAVVSMGGRPHEIILSPLGSLRGPRIEQRPIETVLALVAGPGANALALLALLPLLYWTGGLTAGIWNPFTVQDSWRGITDPASSIALLFKANYWLFLLNMLPCYPLDGGRMLREMLSLRFNAFQATVIAVVIGGLGGLVISGIGLWFHLIWFALVGCFIGYTCFIRHRELEFLADSPDNEFGYDFSEGYTSLERSMLPGSPRANPSIGRIVRGWVDERRKRQGEELEAELDRILEKIHTTGIGSLTRVERRTLAQASRRRRP